jgi:hypothetical protein
MRKSVNAASPWCKACNCGGGRVAEAEAGSAASASAGINMLG